MYNWRLAACLVASLLLTTVSLAFAEYDLAALLCVGIAFLTGLLLLICAVANQGRRRFQTFIALAVYLFVPILLLTHYSATRDHVRWMLLSRAYRAKVLEEPTPANGQFKHIEWDGWGFAGEDTTSFLVFDPTNSLAKSLDTQSPVKARGLPCGVVYVRRLGSQWYVALFYTDTYWGQDSCK